VSLLFLLDSNILSDPLRANPSERVLKRLERRPETLATASPVWHEMNFGCARLPDSRRRRTIESYLERIVRGTLPILPYDTKAAEWHARERARLEARGRTPPFVDGQIAAIAVVNNLTLVTDNEADFSNFRNLRIENWHA